MFNLYIATIHLYGKNQGLQCVKLRYLYRSGISFAY